MECFPIYAIKVFPYSDSTKDGKFENLSMVLGRQFNRKPLFKWRRLEPWLWQEGESEKITPMTKLSPCLSIINNKLQTIDYQVGAAGGNRTLVSSLEG